MASEDLVLDKVLDILTRLDECVPIRMDRSKIGMPDVIACYKGRFVAIEVKHDMDGEYKITEAQRLRLLKFMKAGALPLVIDKDNVNDLESYLTDSDLLYRKEMG